MNGNSELQLISIIEFLQFILENISSEICFNGWNKTRGYTTKKADFVAL
jgi:hypothetical protein